VWWNISIAIIAGLAVQWSTTGSSIIIAYHTAPQGIGCFSIYYILYAGLSSMIALILLLSMLLSHVAMLKRQDHIHDVGSLTLPPNLNPLEKSTIATRLLGKCLAITNALGLVVISLLQLSKIGFASCLC
jgi:hypothetical protein